MKVLYQVNSGTLLTSRWNDGLTGLTGTDYAEALKVFDNDPINLLAIPGVTDVAVLNGAKDYAWKRQDVFNRRSATRTYHNRCARDYKLTEANIASMRVALYYLDLKLLTLSEQVNPNR